MLDASCASMPSLPPRRRVPTSRPAFAGTCCLRPTDVGSASKASHFRGHQCVRLRYGLTACCPRFRVAFRASFNRSVSLTIVALLRGSGFCPGGSVSHWTHLPFLDTQPDVTVSRHPAPTDPPQECAIRCQWAKSIGSRLRTPASQACARPDRDRSRLNLCIAHRCTCSSMRVARKCSPER